MLVSSMILLTNTTALGAPEAPLDATPIESTEAQKDISSELQKDCQAKQIRLQHAISRFGDMGVGVTPFQAQLNQSKQCLADGKANEAAEILAHLEDSLREQQNRYYSNKWQSWHNERKLLAEAFRSKQKNQASVSTSRSKPNNMSKAVGSVISKKDTKYNPVIYPIAR